LVDTSLSVTGFPIAELLEVRLDPVRHDIWQYVERGPHGVRGRVATARGHPAGAGRLD
jgi:hypothetical protein